MQLFSKARETLLISWWSLHCILAPHLLGGVFDWAIIGITLSSFGLLGLSIAVYGSPFRSSLPLIAVILSIASVWTLIQCIPWPCAWLPESHAQAQQWSLQATGNQSSYACTISYDLGESSLAWFQTLAQLSIFLSSWLIARRRNDLFIIKVVALAGLLIALSTLGHQLTNATHVYGLYTPVYAGTQLLSPLLNPNHLASLCTLGLGLCIVLTWNTALPLWRSLWGLAAVILLGTVMMTLSRGGIATAFAMSVVIMLSMHLRSKKHRRSRLSMIALLAISLGGTAGIYVAGEGLLHELQNDNVEKLDLAWRSTSVIGQQPWLGVGRGAFSQAFVSIDTSTAGVRFTHPENFIVQWLSEWGCFVGLIYIVGLIFSLGWTWIKTRSPKRAAIVLVAWFTLLHDLVDFSLEILSLSTLFFATLGYLTASHSALSIGHLRPYLPRAPAWLRSRSLQWSLGAMVLGCGLWLFHPHNQTLRSYEYLDDALTQPSTQRSTIIHNALRQHPLEPGIITRIAHHLVQRNDPNASAWIAHARQLAPMWPTASLLESRWHIQNARASQAIITLWALSDHHPRQAATHLCRLLKQHPKIVFGASDLLSYSTKPEYDTELIVMLSHCLGFDRELQYGLDRWILSQNPRHPDAAQRVSTYLIHKQEAHHAVKILKDALKAKHSTVHQAKLRIALARAYRVQKQHKHALHTLNTIHSSTLRMKQDILLEKATILTAMDNAQRTRQIIQRLRALVPGEAIKLARIDLIHGQFEIQMRHHAAALAAFERSNALNSTPPARDGMARSLLALGNRVRAKELYQSLCQDRQVVNNQRFCQRAQSL